MEETQDTVNFSNISFIRKELWLEYYKENPEFDMEKLDKENNLDFSNPDDPKERMMSLSTPCRISVSVDTDKEEITVYIAAKFELASKQDFSNAQLAFETKVGQNFMMRNFYDSFYVEDKKAYVVPKEFANMLVYRTISNSIGMIEAIPKRKELKKFNIHLTEKLRSTILNDIISNEE